MMQRKALLILFLGMIVSSVLAQTIYLHNFNDGPYGIPYTLSPTSTTGSPTGVFDSNLSSSSWTNSSGSWVASPGASGNALSISIVSAGTQTNTLTFNVATGYNVSITSFSFWRRRAASGPTDWSMEIDGTNVGSGTVPTTGANTGSITISPPVSVSDGQANVVITLTGSTGGSYRMDDFLLSGIVAQPNQNAKSLLVLGN